MNRILTLSLSLTFALASFGQVKPKISPAKPTSKLSMAETFVPILEKDGKVYSVKSFIQNKPGKITIVAKPTFVSTDLDGSNAKEHILDYSSTGQKKLYFHQAFATDDKLLYIAGYKDKAIKGMKNLLLMVDPNSFTVEKFVELGEFTGKPSVMQYYAMTNVAAYNPNSKVISLAWMDENNDATKFHILSYDSDLNEIDRKSVMLNNGALYNFDMSYTGNVNFAIVSDLRTESKVYTITKDEINETKTEEILSAKLHAVSGVGAEKLIVDYPGNKTYFYTYKTDGNSIQLEDSYENGSDFWLMNAKELSEQTILVYTKMGDGNVPDKFSNTYAGVSPNTIKFFDFKVVAMEGGKARVEKTIPRKTISAYTHFFDYIDERTVEATSGFFIYEQDGIPMIVYNENGIKAQYGYHSPQSKLKYVRIDGREVSTPMPLGNLSPSMIYPLQLSNGKFMFDTFGKKPVTHGLITIE